jgi:hypothetical protein
VVVVIVGVGESLGVSVFETLNPSMEMGLLLLHMDAMAKADLASLIMILVVKGILLLL